MLHTRISETTRRAFGRPINPHLFRDCAVTTVALDGPKHISIAPPPILGHTDPRRTSKHHIQAQQVEAGRKYQRSLKNLRGRLNEGTARGRFDDDDAAAR